MSLLIPRPTNTEWARTLRLILDDGSRIDPHGSNTLEIIGNRTLWPMYDPILTIAARKMGYRFAAAEAAWILEGDNRASSIVPYARALAEFSDDGVRFFGAYGPPIVEQMTYIVTTLGEDPRSRQAVLTIWRPNPGDTRDVPCTVALQFLIRNGTLICVSTMRSNDAWLGTVYDIHTFSRVAQAVAIELRHRFGLDVTLGVLVHNVGSHHLYESNLEAARLIVYPFDPERLAITVEHNLPSMNPSAFETTDDLITALWKRADS